MASTLRTLSLSVGRRLSPEARSKAIAAAARQGFAEIQASNRRILGTAPAHEVAVDGRAGAPLESVNPDHGAILFAIRNAAEALGWIAELLVKHSPVRSGRYAASHVLMADGQPADVRQPPPAREYVFVNTAPYARKIEGEPPRSPLSRQAPEGVYQVVAALAASRFGNSLAIDFGFRSPDLSYVPGTSRAGRRARQASGQHVFLAQSHEKATRAPAIFVVPR